MLFKIDNYVKDKNNKLKVSSSSTYASLIARFRGVSELTELDYISIKEELGSITIYLIFSGITEENKTKFLESRGKSIWKGIHELKGAGIITKGDYEVSSTASNGQLIKYSYSLGKRKYVYMKIKYSIYTKGRGFSQDDKRIKEVYREIVSNDKERFSKNFDYQDFLTPVLKYEEIDKLDIWAYIADKPADTGENPENINTLSDDKFSLKNQNYKAEVDEILIYDFSDNSKYVRVDPVNE